MLEDGDVVEIDYVGRIRDSGEIFDLTSEELAAEEGYDTAEMDLGPVTALIGAHHVIPGLEAALRDMDAGEEATVQVESGDAFGERDGDAIETFPEREFEKYDVQPRRGLVVEVDGRQGKIVSTSSGRVRVDFNHPLAGKDLEYDVEVLRVLDSVEERVDAVLEYYGLDEVDDLDVAIDDGTVTATLPEGMGTPALEQRLSEELGMVKGVETVEIA